MRSSNIRIGSSEYLLRAIRSTKLYLIAFHDRRFIENDEIRCLFFGQHEVRDWQLRRKVLENHELGQQDPDMSPESSLPWSTLIKDFTVSPSSEVPSLSNYDADQERISYPIGLRVSEAIFTLPNPGMIQIDYADTELGEVIDFH